MKNGEKRGSRDQRLKLSKPSERGLSGREGRGDLQLRRAERNEEKKRGIGRGGSRPKKTGGKRVFPRNTLKRREPKVCRRNEDRNY